MGHPKEENTLNPFEFRIAASDTKGHSSRNWFRCVPAMGRIVDQIVQSKVFPYRTKGDLLRHGLSRHIRWLESIAPVRSVTAEVDTMLEILRDEEFYSDFVNVFDKLGERVNSHMSGGSVGEARRLLLNIIRNIDNMPEGYWRDRYKLEVENKYGHILKAAPKARLGVVKEDG
jgi:hypothetical protein